MKDTKSQSHSIEHRLARLEKHIAFLSHRGNRISRLRLLFFLMAALSIMGIGYTTSWLPSIPLVVSGFLFIYLVGSHSNIKRALIRAEGLRQIKHRHLAQLNYDWDQLPVRRFTPDPTHPFSQDLDIVGRHSLHQLTDTSTSIGGSNRLCSWLVDPDPNLDEILLRQRLIQELANKTLYRDRLNLESALVPKAQSDRSEDAWIKDWLSAHGDLPNIQPRLVIASLLLLSTYGLLVLTFTINLPQIWILPFTLYVALFVHSQITLTSLFSEASTLEKALQKFRAVFRHIERFSYHKTPHLLSLCEPFRNSGERPSDQLRRMELITTGITLRTNSLVWILANILTPWDLYFGQLALREKEKLRTTLPNWLDVWFELEALSSLANFAKLNPEYAYPEIHEDSQSERPLLNAKSLGHPLIPVNERVCNDFRIDSIGQIAIITGSNMSGKSTFLRTVGINFVLAFAGGPVCATQFEAQLVRLFSCIRVSDSVTDGFSYFYAEVRRLKVLLDKLNGSGDRPVLYLIDEIFRGTNNRERLIGSRSYIKAVAQHDGIGLISTHDLELVKLSEEIGSIHNYHFKEEIEAGKMSFDYKLHRGPCPTTNALLIMEIEGLPVDEQPGLGE